MGDTPGDGPDLAFGYDSSSVDGRASATNNQASWVGLGWNPGVGFIECKYRSCVDDGDAFHADLCWQSPYPGEEDGAAYVISLDGVTSELIRTPDGTYRMADDRGWRVEHLTGGPNSDNTGKHWVVSTPDGEKHTFGNRGDSNWTVPVVGDDAGEPCHATAPVPCRQTWRWNLDRIADADENVTTLFWTRETNTASPRQSTPNRPAAVNNGDTPHSILAHAGNGAVGVVAGCSGDRLPGADLTQGALGQVVALGQTPHDQVAVGHDALQLVAVDHQHIADVLITHDQRGLADRSVGRQRNRIGRHHVSHEQSHNGPPCLVGHPHPGVPDQAGSQTRPPRTAPTRGG